MYESLKKSLAIALLGLISIPAGQAASLPIFPPQMSNKQSLELGEVIKTLMVDKGNNIYPISWQSNNPNILWLDNSYTTDANLKNTRIGLARVNFKGKISTFLERRKFELTWRIVYLINDNPKWGVKSIHLFPADHQPREEIKSPCFGTEYKGCDFNPIPSLIKSHIKYNVICKMKSIGWWKILYALEHPHKETAFLLYDYTEGSGGGTTDLTLYPEEEKKNALEECQRTEY